MARLHNPSASLRKTSRDAVQALGATRVEGLSGLTDRIREAVLACERLARLLDRLSREGFRGLGALEPLPPDEVRAATAAIRVTIGALATTTPSKLSVHFDEYTRRVEDLLVLALRAAERGIAFPSDEEDA